MAFKKGISGNPNGRKKGVINKTTSEWRTFINKILSANFNYPSISADLKNLPPKQRMELFVKLLDYVTTKPTSEELNTEKNENTPFMDNFLNMMHEFKERQRKQV